MTSNYRSEDSIQQECYMWFHNTYPHLRGLLFAVPNGGLRDKRTAKILKDTGTYPGVSDLIFLYNGVATLIEMKTPRGYQSKDQKTWEKQVKKQGFDYVITRSLHEFSSVIKYIMDREDRNKTLQI